MRTGQCELGAVTAELELLAEFEQIVFTEKIEVSDGKLSFYE